MGAIIINLDEHESIETHGIDLYVNTKTFFVLQLNIFQKKFKNLLEIEIL